MHPSDLSLTVRLIGPVGCGKSAVRSSSDASFEPIITFFKFISKAIGTANKGVGHELCPGSHTQDIVTTRYKVGNSSDIVLVDTPGFGDVNMTEIQVLHKISKWLHRT